MPRKQRNNNARRLLIVTQDIHQSKPFKSGKPYHKTFKAHAQDVELDITKGGVRIAQHTALPATIVTDRATLRAFVEVADNSK